MKKDDFIIFLMFLWYLSIFEFELKIYDTQCLSEASRNPEGQDAQKDFIKQCLREAAGRPIGRFEAGYQSFRPCLIDEAAKPQRGVEAWKASLQPNWIK